MISSLYFLGDAGKYKYEAERLVTAFIAPNRINIFTDREPEGDGRLSLSADSGRLGAVLSDGEIHYEAYSAERDNEKENELELCGLIYGLLKRYTGKELPWGILTGVRPVKVIKGIYERLGGHAEKYLTEKLHISERKLETANSVIAAQKPILAKLKPDTVSLYVSVPFCPTRCSYCSFISSSGSALKLKGEYLELLLKELDVYNEMTRRLGLKINCVYIGGGTPTVLESDELSRLLEKLSEFELNGLAEFTAEAGRPDTVTEEKLRALKKGGVTRISINPQTLNDGVLKRIGRAHTARQVYEAFALARRAGFDNINADIIAGLPDDTADSFHNTLSELIGLSPENITVHTLSLKRSSSLYREYDPNSFGAFASEMVAYASDALGRAGYYPYYLYRQKNIADNLENVGYCKAGYECLYNIFIMEEVQSILAAGCAASSKLVGKDDIRRVVNFKYPYEYISEFDEVISRKREIEDFLNKYLTTAK